MNKLQSTILAVARDNLHEIRALIGYEVVEKILCQLEKEEKEHRAWGRDFKEFHPQAPSVANVAIVDLSRLWIEYSTRNLEREHLYHTRLSHILIWSLCAGKNLALKSADFDYCTFIHGNVRDNLSGNI